MYFFNECTQNIICVILVIYFTYLFIFMELVQKSKSKSQLKTKKKNKEEGRHGLPTGGTAQYDTTRAMPWADPMEMGTAWPRLTRLGSNVFGLMFKCKYEYLSNADSIPFHC